MSNPLIIDAPKGQPLIDYHREFEFPVHSVFAAHTDPDLYARWNSSGSTPPRYDLFEPRSGGAYRWVQVGDDGVEYVSRGVFHSVRQDEFLLQTFEFEGYPDVVTLEYSTFTELPGGRSRLTGHSVYPSVGFRDEFLSNGMGDVMSDGYNQLDELLASVRAGR
ncbi:SRPBCC domain-containing protein [Arthrobacter zhaoxinii]|uniref:SRPBCC domain-containing protein n=1 Tax=Arthrobacter zhaoxinii TaxID=2964616 RepID=A0ABY5YRH3_9MICC|nr:SRPBCC domain-containing protein [Arthrobacter zhaoxinii]UWX97704.1 SRPBCC domain-containing protein [Arthrobacter zhaoxinii]